MAWVIYRYNKGLDLKKYNQLFCLGQISAFGMLFTFPFLGYHWPSIGFSTLSVVFSYAMAYRIWIDAGKGSLPMPVIRWFRAAVVMLVLSTFGTFFLAWLMMQKGYSQEWYIGAVYFFLHFQYNGWFLFAILGFFYCFLSYIPYQSGCHSRSQVFWLLLSASIPAYFLSALWMRLPAWMYWSAVLAGILQLAALCYFTLTLLRCVRGTSAAVSPFVKWLWGFALLAFVLKILMQALSVIPSITHFAFGFRPIVIGYLHMVLLGMVSFFMMGFFVQAKLVQLETSLAKNGMILFIGGVLLMEALLMLQGVYSIWYIAIPKANEILFGFALLIFAGLLCLLLAQKRK
jgi:hypothetical protein